MKYYYKKPVNTYFFCCNITSVYQQEGKNKYDNLLKVYDN